MADTRSRAARTDAPDDDKKKRSDDKVRADNLAPGTDADAVAGPARTTEQIDAERRRVQPHAVAGAEAGNRLLHAPERKDGRPQKQKEVSLESVTETNPDTALVVLKDDVYEEVPAPGAPDRMIQRLLYRKGRTIKKSELDRALAAQRKAKRSGGDAQESDGDGGGE